MEKDRIRKIVRKHRHEKSALLAILHEVQAEDKQLDTESLKYISKLLKVPYANVYGLVTFYSAFSTTKKGKTVIKACDGISCHINGANEIIETLKSGFNLDMGETTWDEKFTLEKVQCLGLCSIGPNVSFNFDTYSKLDKERMEMILEILQKKAGYSK
jgi:NADH:ubiquinone oxidoreductase subunit E